ncbi:ribonuclease III [Pelagibacterium xiamenense]|uniref:ribonuclease III n=1 Tax=Pelagibacterium xiamenense TaxID=2901140 RepID=UPI001E3CE1E3|nr:ribonuclease III [Pelagibacterium xiamenense]MCD7060774.1 ribonuclease III [Pelagibacterium xiamenense]
MSFRARDRQELEQKLGHRFEDPALLKRALTHSSAVAPSKRTADSYQRLEFLGDRVLGLVVADLLSRRLPKANEGELSRTLNSMVRKETCAKVARELDLGAFVRLGESEARTGGADKDAILGDVCEALIGAIYADGGLDPAYAFVETMFGGDLDVAQARRADAKTALQEWAQGQGLEPPRYTEVGRSGPDHAPTFTIEVAVKGYAPLSAVGTSKKLAEHQGAAQFLVREKVWKNLE